MSEERDYEDYKKKLDKTQFGEVVAKAFPEVKKKLAEDMLKAQLTKEAAMLHRDKLTAGSYNMSPFTTNPNVQPKPPPPELLHARDIILSRISRYDRLRDYELKKCNTRVEYIKDTKGKVYKKRIIVEAPESGDQRKATVRVAMIERKKQQLKDQVLKLLENEIGCYTGNIIAHWLDPRNLGLEEGQPMHFGLEEPEEEVEIVGAGNVY
jgi:hypothetical protein